MSRAWSLVAIYNSRLLPCTRALTAAVGTLVASAALADNLIVIGDGNTKVKVTQDRIVYTFLQDSDVKVIGSGTAEVLIVGGGGGSGSSWWGMCQGGGGGGGVYHNTAFALSAGDYKVIVGAGGAAAKQASEADQPFGNNGGESAAFGITVAGGGGGGCANGGTGRDGGCGGASTHGWVESGEGDELAGGGSVYSTSVDPHYHGCPAGSCTVSVTGAGGGGAGGAGENSSRSVHGKGGIGYLCSITGEEIYYGTGGNGSSGTLPCAGGALPNTAGVNGLGGGAGGATGNNPGPAGGSGVVIVSVPRPTVIPEDSADFLLSGGDERALLTDGTAHIFRKDGVLTVTGFGFVEMLVVGGGGGGGCGEYGLAGAGGGGGAVLHLTGFPVGPGTYPIRVGAGGLEIPAGNSSRSGNSGGDSIAFGLTVRGGGGGAGANGSDPGAGGCGGGATIGWGSSTLKVGGDTVYTSEDFGFHASVGGATSNYVNSAGGGGAGGPAQTASSTDYGVGGDGYRCIIDGRLAFYGAGGSGANAVAAPGGSAYQERGTDGLGAGGGGGSSLEGGGIGPAGGSGVVIIRYRRPDYVEPVGKDDVSGGDVYEHRGGYGVRTFTQNGVLHLARNTKIEYLLVGGGGGGGGRYVAQVGGGGGAGGIVTGVVVLAAGDYSISVGAGGCHGVATMDWTDHSGGNGGATSAFGLTAFGGGGGAGALGIGEAKNGASGGGGAVNTWESEPKPVSPGQAIYADDGVLGHDGGKAFVNGIGTDSKRSGGGGGAGGPGGDATLEAPGAAGAGITVEMLPGKPLVYAAGGCAFEQSSNGEGHTPALANTGNGGDSFADGGSGVVVVRYQQEKMGLMLIVK